MIDRRNLIETAGGLTFALASGQFGSRAALAQSVVLPFANGERVLVKYPQKRPLIKLTERPPQLETPFAVFDEGPITANDAFFVRYHLGGIPLDIDVEAYRLEVGGKVDKPLSLSLTDLQALPQKELVAVNQCSGNSRGFVTPRVGGGQLGNGAMGNARWLGVSLKSVLEKAGVQTGAKQVVFDGLDGPVLPQTPDFAKSLDVDHAGDGDVMLAWSMNGADLPWLNGYPLRLIVPGCYGTYWVKHLNKITIIDSVLENFWMKTAYRIPENSCACVAPGTKPDKTVPIGRFNVRSFITNIEDGAKVRANTETLVRGIAFDGGNGIKKVELSVDGGTTWVATTLGEDLGKYSFRTWQATAKLGGGKHALMVRATSGSGETQPAEQRWNPSGYMRNNVESVQVDAA